MRRIERILVRAPNWIGDQVLAYPFFHFLRKAHPRARIVSACVPWVEAVQFRNLVDDVLVLPRPATPGFGDRIRTIELGAREARALGPWDLAISLPNSMSTAWFLYRSGAKARRGYSSDGRGILLTERVQWDEKPLLHRSEAYVKLLPGEARPDCDIREFWGVPPENELDPGIPGVLDAFDAAKAWPDAEPVEPPGGDYWVLAPGTTAETRRWPTESFIALARKISDDKGIPGLIVGGPAEATLGMRLAEEDGLDLRDWTGQGTAASYWKVFNRAKFVVSNDSGLAHLASLCGAPVQVAWGGGDPRRTKPMGPGKVQAVFNPVDCWPCERNACMQPPEQKIRCMRGIQPETLWEEIKGGFRV